METVILVKYTSHLIYELVSTLPIRNGNAAPVAFFFTTPAYDGDVVSTLPIRNGNISWSLSRFVIESLR